jgi:cobalt-zinc-cadmium efflux system membrane fusion protein
MSLKNSWAFIAVAGMAIVGCEKSKDKPAPAAIPAANVTSQAPDSTASAGKDEHGHEGWWCDEHGVPESVCAQCNSKLAAEFKAKDDWCKMHDRPDSQCFICHPELEAKFAAQYEAKFGKKPPKPTGG